MPVIIDTSELIALTEWIAGLDAALQREMPPVVLEQTEQTARVVKSITPVDTYRAAGSWWEFTGGGDETNHADQPADTVHLIEDNGLTITQGSRVPYFGDLNEGSSKKAPAGFVDVAAENALLQLEQRVRKALDVIIG